MKEKKVSEQVLQRIFDVIVHHYEWMEDVCHHDISSLDFGRYFIGARYALGIALDLDSESCVRMAEFFDQKLDEYFGGKESE